MKTKIKKIKYTFNHLWLMLSVYMSFYQRYTNIRKAGLIVTKLTKEERSEYLEYWRKISPFVSVASAELSKSFSGIYNKYIVPEEFFAIYIEKKLNARRDISFLSNKTVYNRWFENGQFPKELLYNVDGKNFCCKHSSIDNIEGYIHSCEMKFPLVFKPAIDSWGGAGVVFVRDSEQLIELIKKNKNFIVQECIIQSESISKINDTINTVRVYLYKPDMSDRFHFLNCSIRMGVNGSLDNETAGGIVCHLKKDGKLNKYAINKFGIKFNSHPNTGFVFENEYLPFYRELIAQSIIVANQVPYARLIGLDMCLDDCDQWRCIEVGMFGQTIRFSQYAGEPFFNKYTDEVVKELSR